MRLIADEILMAYADDELEPKARGAVLDALTRDAEVVRRLDVFLSTRTSLARLYQAPMHEVLPQRFAALLRDDGQVNVYRPERGAWLRRLKFFVTSLGMVAAPAFSAAIALGLGTARMLHSAIMSPLNSPPNV
jgi:anti-sigma factor RsiW